MPLTHALKLALGIAAMMVASMQAPRAEVIFKKSVRYYAVGGHSTSEIDKELARRGPMSRNTGMRHPGTTEIRFGGEVSYVEQGGRCRVGAVKVRLTTRINLPSWKNRAKAGPEMALIWDTLSSDIMRHEDRHVEIARNHARALDEKLSAIPSASRCKTLQDRTAELTRETTAAHDADQAKFDQVEAINFQKRLSRLIRHRAGFGSAAAER